MKSEVHFNALVVPTSSPGQLEAYVDARCIPRVHQHFPIFLEDQPGRPHFTIVEIHDHHLLIQGPPLTPSDTAWSFVQHQYWVKPQNIVHQLNNFWQPIWQKKEATDQNGIEDLPSPEVAQRMLQRLPPATPMSIDLHNADEWKQAVKRLRPGSARGVDMISASELQLLPQECIMQCRSTPMGIQTGT